MDPISLFYGIELLRHVAWLFVGITILWFDMALTLSDEVCLIWRRPKSISSVLFFANRYLLAFFNCFFVLSLVLPLDSMALNCAALELSLKVMQLVAQSVVLLIFVLRTYALYGCSRKVLVSLSSLALAVVIGYAFLIVWTMIFSIQNWDDFDGISFTGMSCLELMESPSWIFWLGLFIFDIVVLVMTLAKTYKVSRELRATPKRMPLASLMLRDGSIYFVMMAVLHLANIVPSLAELWSQPPDMLEFFTSLIFYDIGSISGPLSILTNCVSVTLTSRLMLNLHEHAHAGVLSTGAEADASLVSGIIFRDLGPTHRPQSDEYALANLDGLEISRQAEDNDYIPPMEIMEPLLMDDDIARVSHV